MPQEQLQLSNFTAGELSPRLKSRTDYARYFNGLDTHVNMVSMPTGGTTKRPGTAFSALAKDQSVTPFAVRNIPFIFSTVQPYQLEFGGLYIRVFKNDFPVLNLTTVTGATNNGGGLIRLALTTTAGLYTGNTMTVASVAGTVEANGTWVITVIDATHVDLQGSAFVHAYTSGGTASTPVEIPSPYVTADIWSVNYVQSADTLFLVCGVGGASGGGYPPMILTRSSHTVWTLANLTLLDGPYLANNNTPLTTLQVSAGGFATYAISSIAPVETGGSSGGNLLALGVATTAGLVTGMQIGVTGVQGTTGVNGVWSMTLLSGTTLLLNGVAGGGAYGGGGNIYVNPATVTINASAVTGINNGQGFIASDVGRALRYQATDGLNVNWVALTIASVISTTQITATVQSGSLTANNAFCGVSPTSNWALGAFSPTLGYPSTVTLWQERLVFGGTISTPNALWTSNSGAFNLFGPTNPSGAVVASNATFFVIADEEVNAIRWLSAAGSSVSMQLGIGTSGREEVLQPATTSLAFGPTNLQVYPETVYGSAAYVKPLRIGKALIFADLNGRKVREWAWYWQMNGYDGIDKTEDNEHVTRGPTGSDPSKWGLRWLAYQQSPYQVIWGGLNNGGLVSFTYDRDQQIWAASRHVIGGQYYGGPPIVESGCIIPSPDASYSELWLVVLRTINGVPTRFIEVMTRYFDALPQDQAWFVDCALQSALTFPAATLTPPNTLTTPPPPAGSKAQTNLPTFTGTGTFTASAAVFAGNAADTGKIIRLNGGKAIVTAPIDTTHVTAQVLSPLLNLAPAVQNAWSCTPPFSSFSGMSFANGETIAVQADGGDQGRQLVAGGNVNLAPAASYAIAGFPYSPIVVTMPFEPQKAAIAMQGRTKRVLHMYLRFQETLSCYYGRRMSDYFAGTVTDTVEPLQTRTGPQIAGQAPPLFTGVKRLNASGGFDTEGQIIITQDAPLPLTVLSINASVDVGDLPMAA